MYLLTTIVLIFVHITNEIKISKPNMLPDSANKVNESADKGIYMISHFCHPYAISEGTRTIVSKQTTGLLSHNMNRNVINIF